MLLKDVISRRSWQARISAVGLAESAAVTISDKVETHHADASIAWVKRVKLYPGGNTATLNPAGALLTTTQPPVYQFETGGITAASGATSSGNLNLTVTGAGITGSPLTVPVALTSGVHTTAALIGAAVRAALAVVPAITNLYTVAGSSNGWSLTRKSNALNDPTLNVAVPGALGVTAAPASFDTTAGALGAELTNGPAIDALGEAIAIPTEAAYFEISVSGGAVSAVQAAGFGSVAMVAGMAIRAGNLTPIVFTWVSGSPQIDIVFIGK